MTRSRSCVLLTKREREVLSRTGKKASSNYRDVVRFNLRKKASRALESLATLAELYPEAIPPEKVVEIVSKLLKHGEITKEDRTVARLPPGLGAGRKRGPFLKIAGDLRSGDGAPQKKPECRRKLDLSYELLKVIYRELYKLTSLKQASDAIELRRLENGDMSLKISNP